MKILKKKNKNLYKKTIEIDDVTKEDKDAAAKMFTKMKDEGGVGLAATQVGYDRSIIVVSHADTNLIMYNPKILKYSKDTNISLEGCLSFPGEQFPISRPNTVLVEWKSGKNDKKVKYFSGVIGRIIQHEIDHNNGITMEMRYNEQFPKSQDNNKKTNNTREKTKSDTKSTNSRGRPKKKKQDDAQK